MGICQVIWTHVPPIVTGSVVVVDDSLYLVAKVIGTETSRVLGASSKGKADDDLDGLATSFRHTSTSRGQGRYSCVSSLKNGPAVDIAFKRATNVS